MTTLLGTEAALDYKPHVAFRGGGLVAMIHGDFSVGAQEYLGRWARRSSSRQGYARWERRVMLGASRKMLSTDVKEQIFMAR